MIVGARIIFASIIVNHFFKNESEEKEENGREVVGSFINSIFTQTEYSFNLILATICFNIDLNYFYD